MKPQKSKFYSVRPTTIRYQTCKATAFCNTHILHVHQKSVFVIYPLWDAVIYIEIAVNIYENSIKWKEIFTRLLSIAFPLACNDDASCRERFVNMTKLHHLTDLHHHTLRCVMYMILICVYFTMYWVRADLINEFNHLKKKPQKNNNVPIFWWRNTRRYPFYMYTLTFYV